MKKFTILILVLVVMLVGGFFVYQNYFVNTDKLALNLAQQKTSNQYKTYKSENLDFSVQMSVNYEIDEGTTYVDFIKDKFILGVGRSAHASASLDDFLAEMDYKSGIINKINVVEPQISGLQAIVRDEIRGGRTVRQCYIFTPEWVYVFSTDEESLYSDLDQIAQSFQYTPD